MKVAAVRSGMYRSRERQTSLSLLLASFQRRLVTIAALPAALAVGHGGTLLGLVALLAIGALLRQGWVQGARSDALRVAIVLGSVACFNLFFLGAFHELAAAVLLLTAWAVAVQLTWATRNARARRVEVAGLLSTSALTLAFFHAYVPWLHLALAAPWLAAGLLAPVWEWGSTRKGTGRP